MSRLLVVRHGPPLTRGICYGSLDVPCALPRSRLRALIEQIAARAAGRPLRLWSSPSARCLQVAEPLARALGLAIRIDRRLREIHFGAWEGRSWRSLESEPSFWHWMQHYQTESPPGGESLSDLTRRVEGWLSGLDAAEPALAIAHAGVIRALMVLFDGRSWDSALASTVSPLALHDWPIPRAHSIPPPHQRTARSR